MWLGNKITLTQFRGSSLVYHPWHKSFNTFIYAKTLEISNFIAFRYLKTGVLSSFLTHRILWQCIFQLYFQLYNNLHFHRRTAYILYESHNVNHTFIYATTLEISNFIAFRYLKTGVLSFFLNAPVAMTMHLPIILSIIHHFSETYSLYLVWVT